MCFGTGESKMTINASRPQVLKDKGPEAELAAAAADYGLEDIVPSGRGGKPIDLTDETLQSARKSQLLRLLQGQGRKSTFLTGSAGDTSTPSLGFPKLYGR